MLFNKMPQFPQDTFKSLIIYQFSTIIGTYINYNYYLLLTYILKLFYYIIMKYLILVSTFDVYFLRYAS